VTANAKPATANNLSIVFLLFILTQALWRVATNMDQYHYSAERWLNVVVLEGSYRLLALDLVG
jgi:hypothetical protein